MSQSLDVHLRTGVGKAFQALALTIIPVRGALLQALAASYLLTWDVAFVCFEYPPTLFLLLYFIMLRSVTYSQKNVIGLLRWASATGGPKQLSSLRTRWRRLWAGLRGFWGRRQSGVGPNRKQGAIPMVAAAQSFLLIQRQFEEHCEIRDQTGIQEEDDTLHQVEKAQVRSFLVHNMSRGRIKMPSVRRS
jgi:hypothetical protein